jgi:hypothetical protein
MRLLLSLLFPLLLSCSAVEAPGSPPPLKIVRVNNVADGRHTVGNAAIVGEHLAITAHHVAYESGQSNLFITTKNGKVFVAWHNVAVIENIHSLLNEEPVSILRLDSGGFRSLGSYHLGLGTPTSVETHRGIFSWESYRSKPGDSGSPILNSKGEVVGLVWGHDGSGSPIMLRITPKVWRTVKKLRGS